MEPTQHSYPTDRLRGLARDRSVRRTARLRAGLVATAAAASLTAAGIAGASIATTSSASSASPSGSSVTSGTTGSSGTSGSSNQATATGVTLGQGSGTSHASTSGS